MMEPIVRSADGGGAIGWIFLIVFFGIIIVLIIVATIGSKKDKNEKLIENDKWKKIQNNAKTSRVLVFFSLNNLIINLKKELNDFEPSIGIKSLGEINKEYSLIIKSIIDSKDLQNIYQIEDFKNEMKMIIDKLYKVRPSQWTKDAEFEVSLVMKKFDSIKRNNTYQHFFVKDLKEIWK